MKKTQKGSTALIAVIVVVIAITAGVIGWKLAKNSQGPVKQTTTQPTIPVTQTQPMTTSTTPAQLQTNNQTGIIIPAGWKNYQAKKYGFEVSFPSTWKSAKEDFGYDEQINPDFGYVSFSPDGTKYAIIQIGVYTKDQWSKWQHKQDEFILGQNQNYIFTSSSDPNTKLSDKDCSGGGQYGKTEQERCKETPAILKTFQILN